MVVWPLSAISKFLFHIPTNSNQISVITICFTFRMRMFEILLSVWQILSNTFLWYHNYVYIFLEMQSVLQFRAIYTGWVWDWWAVSVVWRWWLSFMLWQMWQSFLQTLYKTKLWKRIFEGDCQCTWSSWVVVLLLQSKAIVKACERM